MALPRVWKLIYATGSDALIARALYDRIEALYVGKPARGEPIKQKMLPTGEPDIFSAVTNCGWDRLALEAWDLGQPGVHRYIETMDDWDEETRAWLINGTDLPNAEELFADDV